MINGFRELLVDDPCDTSGHDKYRAIVHDRDCDRRWCRACYNVHRCGREDAEPCPTCGGWGRLRHMRTGVIAFSYEGLFVEERCEDCRGTGRATGPRDSPAG